MNPVKAWNTFWFKSVSARPLGLFRICLGMIVLAHLFLVACDLDHWLTDRGVLQGDEARIVAGPLRLSPLLWVQDPASVRVFMLATAAVAVAVIVGWHTRINSIALYLMVLSIHHRNVLTNSGPDTLLVILLFYNMLSPSGAAYSLDARRRAVRRGTVAEPLIVPWAQRLIQVQICLMYFITAILKCNGSSWFDGTALHYVAHNVEVRRFDLEWLCQYPLTINFLTSAGLLTEFALAFFLWFRPTRCWTALAGIMLHFGVFFLVNVPLFGEMMTISYLLFLTPPELDTFLGVVNPRNWLRRKASTQALTRGRIDDPHELPAMHPSLRGRHALEVEEQEAEAV